jgi:hypothetical protein
MLDETKSWPTFYAYGPYDLVTKSDGTFNYSAFKKQATDKDDWGAEPGCYVICRAARGKLTPLYIGKSDVGLLRRVYQHRLMIGKVTKDLGPKTRLKIFMLHYYRNKGIWNSNAIDALETELISIALRHKIRLRNIQKTNARRIRIAGVWQSKKGERTDASPLLKKAMRIG